LAAAVPGIDFIVGGHSHTTLDKWQWVGNTLIAQAGAYARYLGRIDFIAAIEGGSAKIVSINGRDGRSWNDLARPPLGKSYPTSPLIPVSKSLPDDEVVAAAYRPFRERASAALDQVIGEAEEDIPAVPSDSGETAAGDLVADAVRAIAKSDIAVVDARSIASGLAKGPISLRDAFNLIGGFTRQQIIVVQMKGSEVLAGLSAGLVKNGSLRLQVSGASASYRLNRDGGAEVSGVMAGGAPINPQKDYTVAGQAYIIQDFMRAYPSTSVVAELAATTREATAEYIRLAGRIGSPSAQRIRAINVKQ